MNSCVFLCENVDITTGGMENRTLVHETGSRWVSIYNNLKNTTKKLVITENLKQIRHHPGVSIPKLRLLDFIGCRLTTHKDMCKG